MTKLAPFYAIYLIFLIWAFIKMSKLSDEDIEYALAKRLAALSGVDPDQFTFEFNTN